jgi:hypothetical protein
MTGVVTGIEIWEFDQTRRAGIEGNGMGREGLAQLYSFT